MVEIPLRATYLPIKNMALTGERVYTLAHLIGNSKGEIRQIKQYMIIRQIKIKYHKKKIVRHEKIRKLICSFDFIFSNSSGLTASSTSSTGAENASYVEIFVP